METRSFDTENLVIQVRLTMDDQVLTTWTSELKDGYKVCEINAADGEAAAEANQAEAAADGKGVKLWVLTKLVLKRPVTTY